MIADAADGLRNLVAGKRVRVAQVIHQDGQQRGIMRQAKGPRRRCTGAGIGVIQPAYQSWVYFQTSHRATERSHRSHKQDGE